MTGWNPRVERLIGRFTMASNTTLLAETDDGESVVYKPSAGERPLWDFPPETLAVREVLAYELSAAMGLDIVPETVLGDGPLGPGSVQRFVDVDESFDPVPWIRHGHDALWPVAVFDIVANNADRKAGHVLLTATGRLFAIDHGLTFHPDPKLRTVLWAFAGARLPDAMVVVVDAAAAEIRGTFGDRVEATLGREERQALQDRIDGLRTSQVHPQPPDDRPAVPWPPY